jgi:hypothetical protein
VALEGEEELEEVEEEVEDAKSRINYEMVGVVLCFASCGVLNRFEYYCGRL